MSVKTAKVWWVLTEKDQNILVREYSGPDRTKAREVAAKLLHNKSEKVIVVRVAKPVILTPDALKAALPKDAF